MKNIKIIKGKKYLVTGGSGFLGVELIKRIINEGGLVRTIARNEGKLIQLKEKFGNDLEIYFGDIADKFIVEQFMVGEFDGIFHLAAFKHVPLAEKFSIECVDSNVIGSINVLRVGSTKNIRFIVGISTDKAAQVSGTYGASKLLMERLFQQYEKVYSNIAYRIVRYGNVLYSTGSVLCKWKDLISQGKEVIVTDKTATRFFWTIDQAIDLIFNCLLNAEDAKPYVPEMKAMSVGDLLDAMIIKYAPTNIKINVKEIGLQKGENYHERILEDGKYSNECELFTVDEILKLI
jgi:UDP-N-acetylglucosamine 4,6-dehydratase/UDP-glucose 4-epimerase